MRLRLTKIDEFQFLICLKHALWGSKSPRFNDWYEGDRFAIIIDKSLAALAEVSGTAFESQEQVWDNGLFPYRIPLRFTHVLAPQDRPPILGEIRDALIQQWGTKYGWRILNQEVLESPGSDVVINAFASRPNALPEYQQTLSDRLDEARVRRDQPAEPRPRRAKAPKVPSKRQPVVIEDNSTESKVDSSAHTRTQSELALLGKITGCSVWIASNDQSRQYAGKP